MQDPLTGAQRLVHQDTAHCVGQGKGSLSGWGWPRLIVRLPCGSPSISSTFFPAFTNPTPRFSQVVVLLTPPFWLAMAMICVFIIITSFLIGVVMCLHSSPGNKKPLADPGVFHITGVALCYWPRVTSRKYGLTPAWRLLLATRKRFF